MKNLKIKLGLFSLLAVLAISVLLTSCEQEPLPVLDDQIMDTQLSSEDVVLPDVNELLNGGIPPQIEGRPSSTENRHYVYEKEWENLGIERRETGDFFEPIVEHHWNISVRSEVSHGSHGGGYYKSNAYVCDNRDVFSCPKRGFAPNDIWVLQYHYYWNADSEEALLCTFTGWVKNSGEVQNVELAINHPQNTPVCGDSWYGNVTYSYFYNPISQQYEWGPTVWSGWHYLPA